MRSITHPSYRQTQEGDRDWSAQAPLAITRHAQTRGSQRNLSPESVRYILTFGREYRRTGVSFFMLRRRDMPREDLRDATRARLVGAVVLVSSDGVVITVYRNSSATRAITRKMKYRIPWKATAIHSSHTWDEEDDGLAALLCAGSLAL